VEGERLESRAMLAGTSLGDLFVGGADGNPVLVNTLGNVAYSSATGRVLVFYTYAGDAKLDGKINADD
jgi:hypothetical protein